MTDGSPRWNTACKATSNTYLVAVMQDVKDYIGKKQAEEIGEYTMSPAGLLGSLASGATGMPTTRSDTCGSRENGTARPPRIMWRCAGKGIAGNEDIASDLTLLAGEWRNAVVAEIGRERYDSLSARLGGRPGFRLCGLPHGTADDRPYGGRADAQVIGGIRASQGYGGAACSVSPTP